MILDPCINWYGDDDDDNNNNNNSNKIHKSILKVVMYTMTMLMLRPIKWLSSGR
jgi:hypothetical protein